MRARVPKEVRQAVNLRSRAKISKERLQWYGRKAYWKRLGRPAPDPSLPLDAQYRTKPKGFRLTAVERKRRDKACEYRSRLKTKFGITPEKRDEMAWAQAHSCAACGTETPGGKGTFKIDHCHRTGRVRGLLCNWCNLALGMVKDDPHRLMDLIQYLARTAGQSEVLLLQLDGMLPIVVLDATSHPLASSPSPRSCSPESEAPQSASQDPA